MKIIMAYIQPYKLEEVRDALEKVGAHGITAAGAALLDDADAASQRTTLGLGTAATQATGAFEAAGAISIDALAISTRAHKFSCVAAAGVGALRNASAGDGVKKK